MSSPQNKDCKVCSYFDKDVTEDPCYACLSGYFYRTYFAQKAEEVPKKETKRTKKKIEYKDKNTPLPWT